MVLFDSLQDSVRRCCLTIDDTYVCSRRTVSIANNALSRPSHVLQDLLGSFRSFKLHRKTEKKKLQKCLNRLNLRSMRSGKEVCARSRSRRIQNVTNFPAPVSFNLKALRRLLPAVLTEHSGEAFKVVPVKFPKSSIGASRAR